VLFRSRTAHTYALAGADPAGLEAASAAFEQMGATLLAAEAAADSAVRWKKANNRRAHVAAQRRAAFLVRTYLILKAE